MKMIDVFAIGWCLIGTALVVCGDLNNGLLCYIVSVLLIKE